MFKQMCKTKAYANIRTLQPKAHFSPYLSSQIDKKKEGLKNNKDSR